MRRDETWAGFRDVGTGLSGTAGVRSRKHGWTFDIMSTSFFLSRRAIKAAAHSGMPKWQDQLFIGLAKSATDATDFFQIPTGRVMEVGTQVTV